MVALRRELGRMGRALPVHQGRGRRGRAARISRLGAGRPGRVALLGIDVAGRPDELLGAALVLLATPGSALWAIAVLGVVCTALGLVVFFQLIAEAGPSRASVVTYINPLVAVLLGVVVLDEHLGAMSVAGLALILGGSWLATRPSPSSTEREVAR